MQIRNAIIAASVGALVLTTQATFAQATFINTSRSNIKHSGAKLQPQKTLPKAPAVAKSQNRSCKSVSGHCAQGQHIKER